jgi:protein phosphatase
MNISGALLALVGAPGSGKSTWARSWFAATQIVSSDVLRGVLTDDETDQDCNREVFDILHRIVRARMRRQRTTVVDATNATEQECRALLDAARPHRYGMWPVAVVFHTDLEVCLAQNEARPYPVPKHAVRRIHAQVAERVPGGRVRLPGFDATIHVGPGWHAVRGYVPHSLREAPWMRH